MMIKKLLFLTFGLLFAFGLSQNKSYEQIKNSTDTREIAKFINANPNHEKTPELKEKLYYLVINNPSTSNSKSTTKSAPVKPNKSDKSSSSSSEKDTETAKMLSHLFDNDPTKKEAYVQIVNNSKCNLLVKFSGKKSYSLNVLPMKQNALLLDKGDYAVSSSVCSAKYASNKKINSDISITLSSQ